MTTTKSSTALEKAQALLKKHNITLSEWTQKQWEQFPFHLENTFVTYMPPTGIYISNPRRGLFINMDGTGTAECGFGIF